MLDERRAYKRRAPQRMLDRHGATQFGRHADIGGLGLARARAVAEFSKGVAVVCMFKLPVLHKQQTT